MAEHDFEELASSTQAAEKLDISVATLRKYSSIVEKVTANKNYYQRNKQKARLYSDKDIKDLRDFRSIFKKENLTLTQAAQRIFAISDQKEDKLIEPDKLEKDEAVINASQVVNLLNMLQHTIASQNQAIAQLQEQITRIEAQNKKLIDNAHQLNEPKDKKVDAKIEAMPDISGVVDTSDEVVMTKEQKKEKLAQEIAADKKKSSHQMHQEILSKARKNQEKKAQQNIQRTLSDMQIPTKKKHWWDRFLNK